MATPTEYELEPIRDTAEFTLYRGRHRGNSTPVLIAALAAERPLPQNLRRLEHEYSLAPELDPSWAAKPLALTRHEGQTILVLSDPGGEFLDGVLDHDWEQPLDVARFLHLAIGLATSLGHVHQRGLIHKDVKPENVLVDDSGHVWLTGFGIASRLPRERRVPASPEIIAGTLAYMAPEQTGRMNRSVDTRSDLYSLGVTLYQMLTGVLPFAAADPLEWVHCHIARQPVTPADRRALPETLSAITMRLLAKNAEERYQTAAGLEADLRRCLVEWESHGRIGSFPLGAQDSSGRLLIPEKLYGREREVEALVAALDRVVAQGTAELVLVSGYSGVGKSSVVNELHRVLVPPRGLFAAGKFDQYKRDIPYATLAEAFQMLVRQILIGSEAEVAKWRQALLEALGPNGQLIVNLIPEVEFVIGKQPLVAELPPQEARGRFQLVFRRFLGAFARPEHPLALFLDDLQWLDTATLELLERLITDPDVRHVLLIGAYRNNEVSSSHPLMRTLAAIRDAGAKTREIVLSPLGLDDIGRLVAEAMRCEREAADPLAQLIYEKTGGNPLFTIQFITELEEERLLRFEPNAAAWRWDVDRIHAKGYTANVVDLMVGKLSRFSSVTQESLKQLACLGNSAEFELLRTVYKDSTEELHDHLWEAVHAGLIFRAETSYRFLHDRVQEAAYSLIPEQQRAQAHLHIGRVLMESTPQQRLEVAIFDIVNQLNRGSHLITDAGERERAAALNLIAGKRAKASTAYASALKYLHAGRSLLGEEYWERDYDLIFSMETLIAACELLTADMIAAEGRLTMLAQRARSRHDFAVVTRLQITLYTTLDRSDRAIDVFLDYLRPNGMDWSRHPARDQVMQEYNRIWALVGNRQIEDLVDLPLTADPDVLDMLDVFTEIVHPAIFFDENLSTLVVCRMVSLCLEHGNCDASCFGYVWFGMFAGPRFNNYKDGFRFGQLGYDLVAKRNLTRYEARTYTSFGTLTPWAKHATKGRELIRRAFDVAYRTGDLTFSAYSWHSLIANYLLVGDPLSEVQLEAEKGLDFVEKAGFGLVTENCRANLGFIRTLRGLTSTFGCFDTLDYNEADAEHHFASNPVLSLSEFFYWTRKLQARFFAGDYASAVEASGKAHQLLWTAASQVETGDFRFYAALARAAAWNSASSEETPKHFAALYDHHRQLEIWALHCPANFETKAALVSAEIARIEGRMLDAEHFYEAAIRSAHDNGFAHCEAVSNECAAQFYAARGFTKIAHVYLQDARDCYLRWGADAKVRQLEERHPKIKSERTSSGTGPILASVEQLDLTTVIRVSEAVSSEIEQEKLIDTLMRTAIEHAGAERGLLILLRGGARGSEPRIEAEAITGSGKIEVTVRQTTVKPSDLPQSALHYVIRTQEGVLLDDAAADKVYSKDEYVRQNGSRSVLCLPIVKQTKLIGALYLENNLTPGVFTPDRVTILQLLSSQAAISLEYAGLYSDLQRSEALLRRREGESRLIVDNIPGLVALLSATGEVDVVNQQLSDYCGQTLGEVKLWATNDTIHPEDLPHAIDVIARSIATGDPFEMVQRVKRSDGIYRWFQSRGLPVRDTNGNISRWCVLLTDIDDQKRAEEALRESEYESRLIVDSIPGMIAVVNTNGVMERGNRPVLDYYGKSIEELRSWRVNDVIHPEDLPGAVQAVAHSLASGDPTDVEMRLRRFDGAYRWFQVRGLPLRDRQGRIVRWYMLETDIDDRKRAEDALRNRERDLRLIIDTIPAVAWSARSDGTADFLNQTYLDYTGLTAEEGMDWGWTAAVHPDDLNGLLAELQRAMSAGGSGEAEARLRRHDGECRWFLFRTNALRDEEGKIVKWYGTNIDIEDRKRTEGELRRKENFLATAQRLSQSGSFSWCLDTNEVVFSEEALRIFGFAPDSPVTLQQIDNRIHPEDRHILPEKRKEAKTVGEGQDYQIRLLMPDGSIKYLHTTSSETRDASGRRLYIGALQDVTQRRHAREALDKAQSELARVTRITALSGLTASIAHEINQPLAGIITNASTCLRMLQGDPPNVDGACETARRTIRDGNRASDVITRLRALFSKKEFALELMDLNQAVREVIALTLNDLQRNRVTVQSELAEDLPPVKGDRVQLQQVILNLIRNASEAMDGVQDRPRLLLIRTERETNGYVRLSVRDAGVGFQGQNMDKIFDSFYTTKTGGMGIGLAVSRSIIDRHRGRLWAEPNDGPGATFAFTIPSASEGVPNADSGVASS